MKMNSICQHNHVTKGCCSLEVKSENGRFKGNEEVQRRPHGSK